MRILPVGFDSSDDSSAVPQLRGNVLVWCCTLAVPPEGSCARAVSGAGCPSGQEQCCAPHALAGGDGYSADLRALELPSNAVVPPVQCWVLQTPRGAHCRGRVMVMVHPPSPGCAVTWGHWCAPHPGAKLQLLHCIKKPLLKVLVHKWCGEEKKCDGIEDTGGYLRASCSYNQFFLFLEEGNVLQAK